VKVYVQGGFRVERSGAPIPDTAWRLSSARTLVKILAVQPGHHLHREQIEALLWPEFETDAAYNNFRKALHTARRALEPDLAPKAHSSYLHLDNEIVSLDPDLVSVDVDEFCELAEGALTGGEEAIAIRARAAYGGELLPQHRYDEWATARRQRTAELHIRLLLAIAENALEHGAYANAIGLAHEILATDRAQEEAHRVLMRAHAATGNRHQALRQYQACRDALQTELDVVPADETKDLYEEILAGRVRREEPVPSPDTHTLLPAAAERLRSKPMVGREAAEGLLLSELEHVEAGHGSLVLLSGEAGIGKSRLIAELCRLAAGRGAVVLWGASYEQEGLLPYGALVEALDAHLTSLPGVDRAALPDLVPELSPLLPSLASPGGAAIQPIAGGEAERTRLYASLTRLLEHLAGSRPLLLVLDDLHAADPATLRTLHYLSRSAMQRSWLVVGAYREEDVPVGGELRHLADTVVREGLCRHIELLALGRPDSDRLAQAVLGGAVSESLRESLYSLSRGNPLFLQELALALRDAERIKLVEERWQETDPDQMVVPRQVRELIGSRVDRLEAPTRNTLSLAAVAGMECSFPLLLEAGRLSDDVLLDAVDSALETRILIETAEGYVFRHPLFRSALYERIAYARRSSLHAAVATALERLESEGGDLLGYTESERRGHAADLAWHFRRGHKPDRAIYWSLRAGGEADAVFAHAEAENQYRTALALAQDIGDQAREAEALLKLGSVLRLAGRYGEALEVLEQGAEMRRTAGDLDGEARAVQVIGNVHHARGTPQEGYARVRAVVERLERLPERSRPQLALAELYVVMGLDLLPTGRYTGVVAASERAAQLIGAAGDENTLPTSALPRAHALTMLGRALTMMGRWAEARTVLEETLPTFEAIGNHWRLAHPLGNIARTYVHQGDLARGRRYWERALELDESAHDPSEVAWASCYLGDVSLIEGDWLSARQQYERAAGLARSVGSARYLSHALLHLADLCALQGNGDETIRYVEEASTLATQVDDVPALRTAQRLLAERDLAAGQPEAARARLHPLLDALGGQEPHAFPPPVLAEAYVAIGDTDRASELVEQRVRRFRDQDHKRALALWLRVQGMALVQQRRWDKADRVFTEGTSLAHAMPYPYAEGRVLQEYGRMLAIRREPEQGRILLLEALALFQRLGARLDVQRTKQALAAL
jgi:DNA-binding SARP family transcriptional activator/tetratricopeptide (TPR) repeat protein